MTAEEQAIVDAVSGALAGSTTTLRGTHWIEKGDRFAASVPSPELDDEDGYPASLEIVQLTARCSGWVKGIVYVGGYPVDLVIEPQRTPYD